MSAVIACEEVVRNIAAHIEGFLPAGHLVSFFTGQNDNFAWPRCAGDTAGKSESFVQANRTSVGNGFDLRARFNLTLGRSDVDKSIQELDRSILVLERLSAAVAANRGASEAAISLTATKFVVAVAKSTDHAARLYSAIANRWICKFHKSHEIKLRLDRRLPALTRAALKADQLATKGSVFEVVFRCDQPQNDIRWHESKVEILEEAHINGSAATLSQPPIGSNPRPKVTISIPSAVVALPATSQKVDCRCSSLNRAITANKMLHLHIASQAKLHCDHRECPSLSSAERFDLYETPWLDKSWSKEAIQFMKVPDGHGQGVSAMDIDFTKPVISHEFSSASHRSAKHLQPKEALLELGITLLELWHEKTIEDHFSGIPVPADYWGKLRLESIWLDDMTNPLLPQYRLAVAQCVKCFFGGRFCSPSWDDFEFRKALVRDMVEPLHENSKPWL
ncbi:uncharacterized protein Z519_10716 [Cladophialophora bantiana CBS 173.52]|uniref:DUF7580 domain-containing protein n=1 Tax=Cladophialophora bantiana (strain ATCC 10958 / CBS 173.52 / CDC B-1940 / NIH 8579) TaxID=1442370 RepID=A0A0D2HCN3_CLAB1|nr:uncharacterized protein Z519_10716 [Cladophialophora bantiana CBS 173.52]KIW88670.1 hypothetical protein Z519_10716 [Cladophialophora bantiana CBS 173.52]